MSLKDSHMRARQELSSPCPLSAHTCQDLADELVSASPIDGVPIYGVSPAELAAADEGIAEDGSNATLRVFIELPKGFAGSTPALGVKVGCCCRGGVAFHGSVAAAGCDPPWNGTFCWGEGEVKP